MVTVENKLATSVLPQIKVMQLIQQAAQMQTVHVSVREVVGVKKLDPQKGRKMAQYLTPFLQQNRKVNVSLEGILMVSPYFLWDLFVYLYQHVTVDMVDNNLTFSNVGSGDSYTIGREIREAKLYVFHRDIYEAARKSTLEYAVEMGYLDEEYLTYEYPTSNEKMEEF